MGSKILAAIIIVVILLVGIFLIAPNAFDNVVPDEYMPTSSQAVSDTDIHWQTRTSMTSSVAAEISEAAQETDETSSMNN